jgi:hypothetical protein
MVYRGGVAPQRHHNPSESSLHFFFSFIWNCWLQGADHLTGCSRSSECCWSKHKWGKSKATASIASNHLGPSVWTNTSISQKWSCFTDFTMLFLFCFDSDLQAHWEFLCVNSVFAHSLKRRYWVQLKCSATALKFLTWSIMLIYS